MTLPIVKTAIDSDEAGVIDALKLAFVADPATRWVWPDPHEYLLHFSTLPDLCQIFWRKRICKSECVLY